VSWLVWRQHRMEGLWVLVLSLVLGIAIAFVANELRIANCSGPGQYFCLPSDAMGNLAEALVKFNLYQYALVVFPALAGAFIGAPMVAREIENGTQRLVWTQGVTRTRWLLTKLVLIFIPVLAAAAILGWLEVLLIDFQGPEANRWAFFDQQAPMTVASTFLALALGVAIGAQMRRSIPAMAVTLIVFVAIRIGIAEIARPYFIAPALYRSTDLNIGMPSSKWWLGSPEFHDAAGHVVNNATRGAPGQAAYFFQYYQPGDRFWTFQTIESAILCALALLLVGFSVYWTARRVS
jgi:ABC-type transport system involved in multi-copper enzyme maturation permease subunit